jgi:putative glutamine amidotransferase
LSDRKPLVGISTTFELRPEEFILPGRPLSFVDMDYARAVAAAGAVPVLIPYVDDLHIVDSYFKYISGLVMTGGGRTLKMVPGWQPDLKEQNPARYEFDAYLIKKAVDSNLPLIGICRGCQMIAEVTGGEISWINSGINHQQEGELEATKPWHRVRFDKSSNLYRTVDKEEIETNSFHRQYVSKVGTGYRLAAWAEDGVVESIEKEGPGFVLGLQFHPEKMPAENFSQKIWQSFADSVIAYANKI